MGIGFEMVPIYRKATFFCSSFIYANYVVKPCTASIFIAPYFAMHETLEHINTNRVNFSKGLF